MFRKILQSALNIAQTDMGNIQIIDPEKRALRIETQHGFHLPFLAYFDAVREGQAACGAALQRGAPVAIEDVADSPIFRGTPALEVLLVAGVRAVQSIPLIGRSGNVLGVISTHWRRPRLPSEADLEQLHLLAHDAALAVEQRMHLKLPLLTLGRTETMECDRCRALLELLLLRAHEMSRASIYLGSLAGNSQGDDFYAVTLEIQSIWQECKAIRQEFWVHVASHSLPDGDEIAGVTSSPASEIAGVTGSPANEIAGVTAGRDW